jgi:hypothetical protein
MENAKCGDYQTRLVRIAAASCRHYSFNPGDSEECILEFTEYILLFLNEEKRSLLLADENEGLLHRVAACFVLNRVRKARLRQSHSVCFSDLPESDLCALASSGVELFTQTLVASTIETLHDKILQLPSKQRYCAFWHWLEEKSINDIASDLGSTPAAVRKNLQYARDSIRKSLEELG